MNTLKYLPVLMLLALLTGCASGPKVTVSPDMLIETERSARNITYIVMVAVDAPGVASRVAEHGTTALGLIDIAEAPSQIARLRVLFLGAFSDDDQIRAELAWIGIESFVVDNVDVSRPVDYLATWRAVIAGIVRAADEYIQLKARVAET